MCAICISSVVSRLIIDAGILENVNLKILSGGKINISNRGVVKKYKSFLRQKQKSTYGEPVKAAISVFYKRFYLFKCFYSAVSVNLKEQFLPYSLSTHIFSLCASTIVFEINNKTAQRYENQSIISTSFAVQ